MSAMVVSNESPSPVRAAAGAAAPATAAAAANGSDTESAASVRVYEVPEEDWRIWRDLRLQALADAPYAFGETLERAEQRDEENWRSWWRAPEPVGPRLIALVDDLPAAMCSICFPDDHDNEPLLISMWTSAAARGRGAARALLDACAAYCARTGRPRLLLGVVEDNLPARRLYESYGFNLTGGSEPLLSDTSKLIVWMELPTPPVPAQSVARAGV
jgi:ribosomal protein S18 acetylase RimI-like enzyme